MRLITRNDTSLVVGLIAGTVVIFQRPLRFVWETALDVQQRYQVDLLPALTIFAGVFIFHEARKRQQAKAGALAAAAEAAQARMRSAELEQLMNFSQALANALAPATLQQALWRYLPKFAGAREFWVLTRRPDSWEMLLQNTTATPARPSEELESIADRALLRETPSDATAAGIVEGDVLCLPMVAAGVVVGVFGIHDGATITDDQRKALGAATGLIAIAVRNVQLLLETREHSLRDGLTNCFNHSHGIETLDGELRRTRRFRQPLSILMFDIDHFKTINDELGHVRGDDLLRAVGAHLTRVLRSTDVRCRYGGDEFLIILPGTPLVGAQQAAEAVRRKMATLALVAGGKTIPVTVSVGIAAAGPAEPGATALIERADRALYQAKREGRDRCSVADAPAAMVDAPGGLPGDYARTVVAGTGGGVSATARSSLFERTFASEDAGGNAMRLAKADVIVEQAGGRIQVDSAAGDGTTFTIGLPATAKPAAAPDQASAQTRLTASVLVVDDEPSMRELVKRILVRAGYEVVTVAGPHAALAELSRQPAISLMLVDVVMPEMDGYDLAAEARTTSPGVRVVFMSAFAPDSTRHPSGDGFLAKPFTTESLTGIVEEVLSG